MTIYFKGIQLFGFHGLYAEEEQLGNWFTLELTLQLRNPTQAIAQYTLNDTIDYTVVYQHLQTVFQQREELLENVCQHINQSLLEKFCLLESITTRISKHQIPLHQFEGSIAVELHSEKEPS